MLLKALHNQHRCFQFTWFSVSQTYGRGLRSVFVIKHCNLKTSKSYFKLKDLHVCDSLKLVSHFWKQIGDVGSDSSKEAKTTASIHHQPGAQIKTHFLYQHHHFNWRNQQNPSKAAELTFHFIHQRKCAKFLHTEEKFKKKSTKT